MRHVDLGFLSRHTLSLVFHCYCLLLLLVYSWESGFARVGAAPSEVSFPLPENLFTYLLYIYFSPILVSFKFGWSSTRRPCPPFPSPWHFIIRNQPPNLHITLQYKYKHKLFKWATSNGFTAFYFFQRFP